MNSFRMARVAPERQSHRLPAIASFSGGQGEDMATKMTYGEQLKHPNWQRKRLEMLESARWECTNCGDATTTLHVHHRQYFKDRLAWEYAAEELAVLCEPCHSAEHVEIDALKRLLAVTSPSDSLAVLGGFHKPDDYIEGDLTSVARQSNPLAFAAGFVAYLTYHLDISQMLQVGEFAASLLGPQSEARLWFTHSRGNTFGEEA